MGRVLIVNADDLGYNERRDSGIVSAAYWLQLSVDVVCCCLYVVVVVSLLTFHVVVVAVGR